MQGGGGIRRPGKTFISSAYSDAYPPPHYTSTTFAPMADVLDGKPDRPEMGHVVVEAGPGAEDSEEGDAGPRKKSKR